MNKPTQPMTPERLDHLLAESLINAAIEGINLTADEIATVRRRLASEYLEGVAWSPSWNCLAAIARILRRPDLLTGGRKLDMFAHTVAILCCTSVADAWRHIVIAHAGGRTGLVTAALEMLTHGPPECDRTDPLQFRLMDEGITKARAARLPGRIELLLLRSDAADRTGNPGHVE